MRIELELYIQFTDIDENGVWQTWQAIFSGVEDRAALFGAITAQIFSMMEQL